MEGEGCLEFSLGCLPQVVRGSRREGLAFPLTLQVLDSTEGRRWAVQGPGARAGSYTTRKIITVSDGFYSKVDCFWLEGNHTLELYSIIKVHNIDFEHQYERGRDLPRIAGMILDFALVKRGSEIGYFSGKPVKLRDRDNGRGAETHLLQDSLSQKLWKQVKEERFCDVTFTFPSADGAPGQTVKAQKNALIANSPVFEAQFEGGFSDASGCVPIEDTQPRYMRGLLQFIFTRFLPLLSLRQAFEMLYLARKYLIPDLESYTKNFILNNKQTAAGVTDVFLFLEMNVKACDDDVRQFAWAQLRSKANVYIRQPRFLDIDFATLESLLAEPNLNCQEWELASAVRRWVVANDMQVRCTEEEEEGEVCAHQLVEGLRWGAMPLREAAIASGWTEFQLIKSDPSFLADMVEGREGRDSEGLPLREGTSHTKVVSDTVGSNYSPNRLHGTRDDFVVYASLGVVMATLATTCHQGSGLNETTARDTGCQAAGPSFQLQGYYMVPSYGLRSHRQERGMVEVVASLACAGRSWDTEAALSRNPKFKAQVTLTAFTFSAAVPARTVTQVVDFLGDRDSCQVLTLTLPSSDLSDHFLHPVEGLGQAIDLQMAITTDLGHLSAGERCGARPSLMRSTERARRARHAEGWEERGATSWESGGWEEEHFRRINSVGRTMQRLRCRDVREHARWQDGWGNVARSPQWRGEEAPWVEVEPGAGWEQERRRWEEGRGERSTVELRSPEYRGQSEAFGDVTRSPQSPGPPDWGANGGGPGAPQSPQESPESPEPEQPPQSPQDSCQESPESPEYSPLSSPSYPQPIPPSPPLPHQRSERWARSPSPGPSWAQGHWQGPGWHPPGPHQGQRPRDPRKRPRRSSPLPGLHSHNSPSPPRPFATPPRHGVPFTPPPPPSPPSPLGGGSTEAAAGSRPGSPQASPPRHPYSPILYLRSPDRGGERGNSPSYSPPASPDVIDIDLEEIQGVVAEEGHVLNQVQNLPLPEEEEEGEEEEAL